MSREVSIRYDLLRGHVKYAQAKGFGQAAVSMDVRRKIKTVFSGDLVLPQEFDPATDRLRPVLLLDGEEYFLGEFLLTDRQSGRQDGRAFTRCEGYDAGYLVLRTRTQERLFFPSGRTYLDCVQSLLQKSGIDLVSVVPCEKTLATDRADWEIGTSVLDIINELLEEIGYRSLWFSADGSAQLSPLEKPTAEKIGHWYGPRRKEGYALVKADYSRWDDRFEKYNVITVLCENPDMDEPILATAVNDDPGSVLSVQHQGQVMAPLVKVKNIPDAQSLQDYADRLLWEQMTAQETTVIETAVVPRHSCGEIVALEDGCAAGIYEETGWAIELSAGGRMEHTLRRVMPV